MNVEANTQMPAISQPKAAIFNSVLQRQCACNQHVSGTGECKTCQKKNAQLQRKTSQNFSTDSSTTASPFSSSVSQISVSASPQNNSAHNNSVHDNPAQNNSDHNDTQVPSSVYDVLQSSGNPLESNTRSFMESRFARDFSQVRIHTNSSAANSAAAVNAQAYTVGSNVVFGSGKYSPTQAQGQHLLAHELTHVVQQGQASSQAVVNRSLEVGKENTPAEIEADKVADSVVAAQPLSVAPQIKRSLGSSVALQRQYTTPQPRGGAERLATIELPPRGEDQVRMRMFRYLCNCAGRDITRSSFSARVEPRPGIVYQFCRGRTTVRVLGEVVPSSFTTGTATATVDINVAPERGGTGGRVQIQGEARNTGDEPQVGGRVSGTIETPGDSPDIAGGGEIFVGTESRRVDSSIGGGLRFGDITVTAELTNPHDERFGVGLRIGGPIPGPEVSRDMCRVCVCPVAYECFEDIPPRSYDEQVPITINERSRLRYYFHYNTQRDARSSGLRAESARSLDQLTQLVAAGAEIVSIRGYASPEAGESERNHELSTQRAARLREIVAQRLGPDVAIPVAEPGGELLGSVPTIAAGSDLADAILDTGFGDAEDVSSFLFGDEITNAQLADQFLSLLGRVVEPEDRLRLFGVSANSPVAGQLLAAIEQFVARRGRGRRPWESVFEFLRFATVEIVESRQEMRTESRQTRGSLRPVGEALCHRYSQQAEDENLFGPAEEEPDRSECSTAAPVNPERHASRCNYRID